MSHTLGDFLDDLKALNHALPVIGSQMAMGAADLGIQIAREQSSGPYSSAQLAAMDHPYATRHGSPMLDPSMINEQSGAFRAHWQAVRYGMGAQIFNDAFYAKWLEEGTPTMFARPAGLVIEGRLQVQAPGELTPKFDRMVSLFLH